MSRQVGIPSPSGTGAANHAAGTRQLKEELASIGLELRHRPNDVNLRIRRAETLTKLGQFQNAKDALNSALARDMLNSEVRRKICYFGISFGILEVAWTNLVFVAPEWKETVKNQIESVNDHFTNLRKLKQDGNWREALIEIDKAIAEGVQNSKVVLAFRAEILCRLNRCMDAKEAIYQADRMDAEPYEFDFAFARMKSGSYLYYVFAQILMSLGSFDNAVGEARHALSADKANVELSKMLSDMLIVKKAYHKGNELFDKGDFINASKEYLMALKYANGRNTCLLNNIAACYIGLEDWRKGLTFSKLVLEVDPGNEQALRQRDLSISKTELSKSNSAEELPDSG